MWKLLPKASALRSSHNEKYALRNAGQQVMFVQPPMREGNCISEKSGGRKGRSDLGTVATAGSLRGAWQSLNYLPSVLHYSDIQALSGECYDSFAHCHLPLPDFPLSNYLSSISRCRKTKARDESRH